MDDLQNNEASDHFLEAFAQIVAGDSALLLDGWTGLVLVCQVEDGTPDMTGFCYHATSAVPVAPSDFAVFDVVERLRDAMAARDGRPAWQAALFRLVRQTGRLTVDFEYVDPERWAVTPTTVAHRKEQFARLLTDAVPD